MKDLSALTPETRRHLIRLLTSAKGNSVRINSIQALEAIHLGLPSEGDMILKAILDCEAVAKLGAELKRLTH